MRVLTKKILIAVFILSVALLRLSCVFNQNKQETKKLQNEFPSISFERGLNKVVEKIVNPTSLRNPADHAFIIFSDGAKATIETELSNTASLDNILSEGDSIVKKANSSTITIYKKTVGHGSGKESFDFQLR